MCYACLQRAQWVTDSAFEAGLPEEAAKSAGGKIYTSGSYRLRIHEPGSDIDAICVAPQFCTRDLFFSGLKERLMADPLVTHVNAIEIAAVSTYISSFSKRSASVSKNKHSILIKHICVCRYIV